MSAGDRTLRGPKPLAVPLSYRRRSVGEHLARRQTSAQRLVRRRQMVRAAADGRNNEQIARHLGRDRSTARTWRQRWLTAGPRLAAATADGTDVRVLAQLVTDARDDAARPGAPVPFTAAQVVLIVSQSP